ncbi:MAG TPA: formylglycine-generating enzyme family protein [Gammaproteobacteria bacterium]|nr:formylglycine-generating enzyme family protein [Gammaproteobacteria bacterium]
MKFNFEKRSKLDEGDIEHRRKFLGATLVTCLVLTFVGGTVHVLSLGSNRMMDMRDKAAYDVSDASAEQKRLRSAGEELYRQAQHEFGKSHAKTYTVEEARALLSPQEWSELAQTVRIAGGEFVMGTDNRRADPQDRPRHKARVQDFEIDLNPVTNAEYARFVAATRHRPPLHWDGGKIPPDLLKHPVTMVSWFDAKSYCEWEGKRLPSEAEWERAARGVDGRRWPWGNKMDPTRLNTYYRIGKTTPVGSFPQGASPDGVLDMAGNVSEWVADDFEPYPDSDAPEDIFRAKFATAPESGAERSMRVVNFVETEERYKVIRGGSWKSDPFSTSAYHRNFSWPQMASDFFGFRCAKDATK